MNPIIIIGGVAAVLLFLATRKTHAMVRRDSPYHDTGRSSFTPPEEEETPPTTDGGFSRGPNDGVVDPLGLPRSKKKTFGGMAVEKGAAMSRADALRGQLKAKPSDGPRMFDDLRAFAGRANPNDTDKWLALYESGSPEIKLAMRSYNMAAAPGPFQLLRIVVPGWTQDLSYGGGLNAKEQQDLIAIAAAALASGQTESTNLSMAQLMPVLQTAFARAQFDPRSDIQQPAAVIEPLIAAYLSEANNAPAGSPDYPKFPPGPARSQAEQITQDAFDQISALSQNLLPDYGQLLGSERAALLLLGYRVAILNEGQELLTAYIQRLGEKYAQLALQSVYDEYGDMGEEEAKRILAEQTGIDVDSAKEALTGLF